MGIFPVINCEDSESLKQTLDTVKTFLPEGSFLHMDIADSAFTFHKTWNNPEEWMALRVPYQFEVHLMVERPDLQIAPWIKAGARRFIVHVEEMNEEILASIFAQCEPQGVGVVLSSNPETTVDQLSTYLKHFSMVQVLAVHPGLAGQPFLPIVLDKIAWLRRQWPHVIIEVDGGMNAETARMVKNAGADFIVSSNYIFGDGDPKIAYGILSQI
jgi:ribulose-phosphate 3-epimerase